jgi:F0F1-type ATP synthase delta subunit
MSTERLKKLAEISLKESTIPEDIKQFILTKLNKNDLKFFLGHFKNALRRKRVYVTSPNILSKDQQLNLMKMYPQKDIIFSTDENIGAGIKIQDNDTIYDMTFRKYLTDLIGGLSKDF